MLRGSAALTRSARVALAVLGTLVGLGPDAASASELDFSPALDRGLLGEARQAYRERRDEAQAWRAQALFEQVHQAHPEDPVAAWHLSLACYYLGMRVLDDGPERTRVYARGREVAEAAIERAPDCAPCLLLAAVNHALWGEQVGIFRTLVGLPAVLRQLERSAELDPAFGGAAAHRVRAYLFRALPRLFGGGKARAREAIEMAIRAAPREPMNHAFLAELLQHDYDDLEGALRVARRGARLPPPGPEHVESLDALRELQALVQAHDATEVARSEGGPGAPDPGAP